MPTPNPNGKNFNLFVVVAQREWPFRRINKRMQIDDAQAARQVSLTMEFDKENKEVEQ